MTKHKHNGPKQKVSSVHEMLGGNWLLCRLECGHAVQRRVKRRRAWSDPTAYRTQVNDPAPTWVYCDECGHSSSNSTGGE